MTTSCPDALPADPKRTRRWLVGFALALLAIAWLAPAIPQIPHYHDFADSRTLLGIPYAMDVLTNLPFLLAALAIGHAMARVRRSPGSPMPLWWRFAGLAALGFAATAVASGFYHLQPDDMRVLWDRLAMSLVFAAVVGLAVLRMADGASAKAAAAVTLIAAGTSLAYWHASGNLTPWSVLQAGGMLLALAAAAMRRPHPAMPPLSLLAIIGWYGLSKLCELADHAVFDATGQWLSGHSLKHLFAALAAWPIVRMLYNGAD